MRSLCIRTCLLVLLAFAGVAAAAGPGPTTRRAPAALDFRLKPLLRDPGFSAWFSGVIQIERHGKVVFTAKRGVDSAGKPFTRDSLFWLGSVSKMMASAMLLQLEAEGRLSLSDPVGKHIPGWTERDLTKEGKTCTIARLLSHQCGLSPNLPLPLYAPLLDPLRRKELLPAFLKVVRKLPLRFAPGKRFLYSNLGYALAGVILLKRSPGTYDEIFQRRLAAPLGLKSTGMEPRRLPRFRQRIAPLTMNAGTAALNVSTWLGLPHDSPASLGPQGGGFSTPRELSRLIRGLFLGPLLQTRSRQSLLRPRAGTKGKGKTAHYGLGVGKFQREGYTELRHLGALEPHGFSTYVGHIPEWDVTLTIFSNRSMGVYSASSVAASVLAALQGKPWKSPFPKGAKATVAASQTFLIHLILLPLLWLSILLAPFRSIKQGRLAWAIGLTTRAWFVLFFRGLLGIHTGEAHAPVLSALLLVSLAFAFGVGFQKQPDLPTWPPRTSLLRWLWTWSKVLVGLALMLFCAFAIQMFAYQILCALAFAAAVVFWQSRKQVNDEAQRKPSLNAAS